MKYDKEVLISAALVTVDAVFNEHRVLTMPEWYVHHHGSCFDWGGWKQILKMLSVFPTWWGRCQVSGIMQPSRVPSEAGGGRSIITKGSHSHVCALHRGHIHNAKLLQSQTHETECYFVAVFLYYKRYSFIVCGCDLWSNHYLCLLVLLFFI